MVSYFFSSFVAGQIALLFVLLLYYEAIFLYACVSPFLGDL